MYNLCNLMNHDDCFFNILYSEATDPEDELKPVKPPPIYEEGLPDPPAGLVWWKYLPDVPPLPTPEEYYNNTMYANYSWRYDPNYVTIEYTFTNLDKVSELCIYCHVSATTMFKAIPPNSSASKFPTVKISNWHPLLKYIICSSISLYVYDSGYELRVLFT